MVTRPEADIGKYRKSVNEKGGGTKNALYHYNEVFCVFKSFFGFRSQFLFNYSKLILPIQNPIPAPGRVVNIMIKNTYVNTTNIVKWPGSNLHTRSELGQSWNNIYLALCNKSTLRAIKFWISILDINADLPTIQRSIRLILQI